MMKILINTFTSENIGQRLQNYALQQVLKKYGDVYTLFHQIGEHHKGVKRFLCKTKYMVKKIVNSLYLKRSIKIKHYKLFNRNICFETNLDVNKLFELNKKYDYFVCGSDQIWNSDFVDLQMYLLPTIPKNKKIAYAASVGKNELTPEDKFLFEKYLNTFKAISVREKEAEELLQPLTNNKVQTVLDPTLLLSAEDWKKVEKTPKNAPKKKYVFLYMLGTQTKEYKEYISNIAKKYDLEIVDINDKKSRFYITGPAEFLYLIRNAKLVLTDSFHAIVFSIINKKPFIHMERVFKGESMSSRMRNLERIFHTTFLTPQTANIDNEKNLFTFPILNMEEILKVEQEKSFKFLDKAFGERKKQNNLYDYAFDCAGCGLCASVCPKGAISYKQNIEGFIRPVIDETKCVHCGLCSKKCVQLQTYQQQQLPQGIMFAKRKEPVEDTSSSAGVFGAMATHILNQGGVVYAVKYDPKQTHFVRVTNFQELEEVKGSKYVQADITKSYDDIAQDVSSGRPILVCGTPCQIAGLKQKFGDAENLYLVKFLCHGVPSQQLFNEYCMQEYGEVPVKVNFRKKDPVWGQSTCEYIFQDGNKIKDKRFLDIFLSDCAINDCCYTCNFAGKQIGADITIGDAWGVQKINKNVYSPNGVSIILPHTPKGVCVWQEVLKAFDIYVVPQEKYMFLGGNVLQPFNFYDKKCKKEDFLKIREDYSVLQSYNIINQKQNTFIKKVKRKLKRIFKIK